jgi:type 1 fimbria pilin
VRLGATATLAAAMMALASGAAFAADDPALKKLVGEWIGQGMFRWDSISDPERLYCRISSTISADGVFRETGRCAVANDSAAVRVEIQAVAAGKYAGSASTGLGLRKPATFTGTGKGNQLVLVATETGEPVPTVLTIDIISGGFRIRAERTDPKTGRKFTATDATFAPP